MKLHDVFTITNNNPATLDNNMAFNNILKMLHDKGLLYPITLHQEMKMLKKVVRKNRTTKQYRLDYILLYSHLLPFVVSEKEFAHEYNEILEELHG